MKIELVDIDNALKYYQINDINYKNKCYKCIEDINTIEDFNIKTEEIYNILYNDKTSYHYFVVRAFVNEYRHFVF